jgi:hypothetical protein
MILSPSSTPISQRLSKKPTIHASWPFLGYFKAMRSTACTNRYCDHRGHTHHVKGTTGGQQGDTMEMTVYSLSQHPIIGRVLDRNRSARGVGFADDLTIYATLQTSLKVLVELRCEIALQLGQDVNLHPRCQQRTSSRTCAPAHQSGPLRAFVRSNVHDIVHDVHKLRIVSDPKIHYDLLRFCQHTRLAFLARNVPPDAMMRTVDVNFDPGRGDWGSGIFQKNGFIPASVIVQDSIVLASPVFWNGSFLQRDCSNGLLAGLALSRLSMLSMGC